MSCTTATVIAAVRSMAAAVAEHKVELTHLDREIGDGDHGENLARGFSAVIAKLDQSTPDTPAEVLNLVATTLISTVGGASGPIFGTAFLRASTAVAGLTELDGPALARALGAARDGVMTRGKAEPGDKTLVDALGPAADAAAATAGTAAQVLAAAATAALQGAHATIPLRARKGRASYLGDRSMGHLDPGATSTAYLLAAAADLAG